jgi:hypothetical protein
MMTISNEVDASHPDQINKPQYWTASRVFAAGIKWIELHLILPLAYGLRGIEGCSLRSLRR